MIDRHIKLFECLNSQKVEYLLIGGTLAIVYGVPRVTKDIDIFLNPSLENAQRCLAALASLGMGTAALISPQELCQTEITIFKDVIRLDVLSQVKGITFEEVWPRRVWISLGNLEIPSLHIDDLIKAKLASARPGDLEDVKILEMARNKPR